MFFAIELQISIVYVLFHLQGLGPSKRSIRYRKIALRYEYGRAWRANALEARAPIRRASAGGLTACQDPLCAYCLQYAYGNTACSIAGIELALFRDR